MRLFASLIASSVFAAAAVPLASGAAEQSLDHIAKEAGVNDCPLNLPYDSVNILKQLTRCIESSTLSSLQRDRLWRIRESLYELSRTNQSAGLEAVEMVLARLQSQVNQLKKDVSELSIAQAESDRSYKAKESALNQTITQLRDQVAELKSSKSPVLAAQPVTLPAEQPPKEAPNFKPTLTISGSANLVIGGVDGPNDSLSSNFWNSRITSVNRSFANESVELMPESVSGATNSAGGSAFAYYKSGQSNQFYPPSGLDAVNDKIASNYSLASSWTGGKVKFTSLSRGGNLIITDPSDPNYDKADPKTLDKAGYELAVNLKGQPILPNSGLGGLKNPEADYSPVDSASFNQKNLGSDITFAGVPLAKSDIQKLINLGNAARTEKVRRDAKDSFTYIAKAGDTISTVANSNSTSASRLLEFNPQLPQSVDKNTILKQGTRLNVPTVGCVKLCQGLNTVSDGGLVTNTTQYDDLLNIAVAEYGSLTTKQQNSKGVKQAAQAFIRSLAGSDVSDNIETEDFNFQRSYTFNNDVKVHFRTSFTGTDLLNISLRYRNILPYGERGRFPALNLAYGFGSIDSNDVTFDRLWWKIPLNKDANFLIGTRYKDYDMLPVQYGTFYPVEQQNYFFASGAGLADYVGSGAGVTIKNVAKNFLGGNLHIGGGYIANQADALNPVSNSYQQKGIIGRDTRFRAPLQVGYVSNDGNVIASLNYVYSRGDTLNSFVGTNLSANPFFYDVDSYSQLGLTFAWQFNEDVSLNLVYNNFMYTSRYDVNVLGVPMAKAGDQARAQSWMAALVFTDFLVDNSTSALAVGQVPYVYSNQSAWGTNVAPFAFEAWYNYPLSDRVFIQPALFFVTNHDGFASGGTDWGSTFRVYLNF